MLQIHNLHANVGDKPILKDLSCLLLLMASPVAHAQDATVDPVLANPATNMMVIDHYTTCLMVGVGKAYPDGPTGTLESREASIQAVKAECEPILIEVDNKAIAAANEKFVSPAEALGPVNIMRREIEKHMRRSLGLPVTN